jgi:hypothetical protein
MKEKPFSSHEIPDMSKQSNDGSILFSDIKHIQNRGVWKKFTDIIKIVKFPSLYGIKGLTHKIQMRIYPIQNDLAQQIFEHCRDYYKTRAQVDRRAYTIGLEWLRIEHLDLESKLKSRLAPILWNLIEEDKLDEEKNTVLEKYKDYSTKIAIGILTESERDRRISELISCFPEDQQRHIERMLDDVDLGGEMAKAHHRYAQRKYSDRKKIKQWATVEGGKENTEN